MWFFQTARDYYKDYNKLPTYVVVKTELQKAIKSGQVKAEEIREYGQIMMDLFKPVTNESYIISNVTQFCRRQAVKRALLEVAPQIDTEDEAIWNLIEGKVRDACNVGTHSLDMGVQYFVDFPERLRVRAEEGYITKMPTGISKLDEFIGGGLKVGQLGLWAGGVNSGKCLQKGTLVLKYNGDAVPVESVKQDDLLMGPDSTPRKVLSTVQGKEELWRIQPRRGQAWACTYDHVLTLVHTVKGNIIDISVRDYLSKNKKFRDEYKLIRTKVNFPQQTEALPLDPYFLGVWLGDGTKALGSAITPMPAVAVTSMDPEIRDLMYTMANKYQQTVREQKTPYNGRASTYFITGRSWVGKGHTGAGGTGKWSNPLLDLLRSVVGSQANIPVQYLRASYQDRAALLAGLIDTDGDRDVNGGYTITQKRKDYAESIVFLARSLGLRSSINKREILAGTYWRVFMYGDFTEIPIRILRKKPTSKQSKRDPMRTGIKSITSIGEGEYYGFMLDGDHRFLLGDFTITHNSICLVHCGKRALIERRKVVHYTLELSSNDIAERYDATFNQIPTNQLDDRYDAVYKKLSDLGNMYGNTLVIKEYPTRTVGVSKIRSHLQQLRAINFIPELVLVDYGDLLKPETSYHSEYEDLGVIFAELRGLAGEFKVPLWSATQLNRPGITVEEADLEHISASMRKAEIADVIVGLNMSKNERQANQARLSILKNRNGPAKITFPIKTDYATMTLFLPHVDPIEVVKAKD